MSRIMSKYAERARLISRRQVPLVKATVGADVTVAQSKGTALDVSFKEFLQLAWPELNPGRPLQWNWHLDAICECLEAVEAGQIKKLVINLPPGLGKSMVTSVMWPVWRWTKRPSRRMLSFSHTLTLVERDTSLSRTLIASDWFRDTFLPPWTLKVDQNRKICYANSAFGTRQGLAVASKGTTGFRAESMIIDDPLDASAIQEGRINIQEAVERANSWYDNVASTRLDNPDKSDVVLIMQRLHEMDLSGHLLGSGKWENLCLREEYDPVSIIVPPIGITDPRSAKGALLFPSFHSPTFCEEQRQRLGPVHYEAQYNQNPTPSTGDYFDRDWFKISSAVPKAEDFPMVIISVDAAFEGTKTSANVSIGVWGVYESARWRIDEYNTKMDFYDTKQAILMMYAKYPTAAAVLIENKANGPALISDLTPRDVHQPSIPCIVPISTGSESKELRALSVQAIIKNGHVWLPADAPWLEAYLREMSGFPRRTYKDRVDETTQVLKYLRDSYQSCGAMASFEASGLRPPM